MRFLVRLLRGVVLLLVMTVILVVAWLSLWPPELLRVGTGYAAKIVCSNVFLAGRDAQDVLRIDVQAPGHPLLRLVQAEVDREEQRVTTRMLHLFAPSVAIHRDGLGCANVPDGDEDKARSVALPVPGHRDREAGADWPVGDLVASGDPRLDAIMANAELAGPGMRAIVVVKDGRIVGEAYGAGFGPETPLLGWSMTKTVNAAIIGRMMQEGRMALDDADLFDLWADDERLSINVAALLSMESGLEFNEDYGDVTDVTRMLYLEPDMAAFAADKPQLGASGSRFNYSSGSAVLLSRIWMDRFASAPEALAYPRQALFDPLGMSSAVMEADARGTFAGSSYLYATARDWGRFGLLLLQDGVWAGERLLPEGFVAAMGRPTAASAGEYTERQAWHVGPGGEANATYGLSEDIFWLQGHDGQSMAVVPSQGLAVVRLGLTPSKLGYRPQRLVKAVIDALR